MKHCDLKDICRVKGIYPVVIHQDFSLRLNGINQIMGEFFREEISKRRVEQRSVRPFCMLSIEDLEIAIPYLVDVPLPDILDAYARNDDPLTTFEIIFKKCLRKQHIKPRRNQWIDKRSDEIQQQIHDLFVDCQINQKSDDKSPRSGRMIIAHRFIGGITREYEDGVRGADG